MHLWEPLQRGEVLGGTKGIVGGREGIELSPTFSGRGIRFGAGYLFKDSVCREVVLVFVQYGLSATPCVQECVVHFGR